MTHDAHEQARQWIALGEVNDFPEAQRAWLQAHLRECESCRGYAEATDLAVRAVRSVPIAAGPALVQTTQTRVRSRARQLREKQERLWLVWMSCMGVGLSAAITTPLLWRGFAWIGQWAEVSPPVWQTGFAVFWIAPALVTSVLLLGRGVHVAGHGGQPRA
ncbi:MAG: zf-HC2 domain-containing protein [Terriglobales bacterium]